MRHDPEVERTWREFWSPIVCTKTGRVVLAKLKRELYDYRVAMHEVSAVYEQLTGGVFSKPDTCSDVIIDRVRELQERDEREAVQEALKDALAGSRRHARSRRGVPRTTAGGVCRR